MLVLVAGLLPALAQQPKLPPIVEIAEVEDTDGNTVIDIASCLQDGKYVYYLDVGSLAIGNEVVQISLDPVDRLFIPLGETLTESVSTMQKLLDLYNTESGTSTEIEACYAPLLPDSTRETVKVTFRRILLGRKLEFSMDRGDHILATYVSRSDFANLMSNLKAYSRMHPGQ